jgi:hypothetical protein
VQGIGLPATAGVQPPLAVEAVCLLFFAISANLCDEYEFNDQKGSILPL